MAELFLGSSALHPNRKATTNTVLLTMADRGRQAHHSVSVWFWTTELIRELETQPVEEQLG